MGQSSTPIVGQIWTPVYNPDLARLVDAASGPDKSRNWRKLLNGWRDRVRQSLFDPFHGLKIAERVGAGLDPIMHTLQSSYVAARMSTSTDTQLWVTLVKGALRWQNNVATFDPDSKGLLDILQPVEDKLNLWKAYMVAKRASRLKKEGRERLITPEMIAAGLALAERHPEFLTVAKEWADFNSRMLDFAVEAGVIDGSMRSLWEHDDYIPFYRVLEGEVGNPTSGQGLSHQQTIKRLKGGTAALNDVFENMLMNTAWLIQASMKNHAMQMAIENLEDSGLVRKAPMTWNKSLIPMSEIKRLAKQDTGPLADMRLALEDMGSELTDLEWEGFQKLWSMEVPKGDDVVMVRKNGKPVWYNVDESAPLLLRALTAMNQKAFGDWIKALRLPKQWLTGFVTADPAFMLANWVRDTGAAFVLSRDGTKPLVSGIRGAIKTLKRDDDYWHMMAAGGGFRSGFVSAQDPEASAKMARKEMRHKDFRTTIIDSPRKLWDRWQDLGSIFENANRMALYEDAIKNGKSRLGAAFESKDFLDFTMRGDNTVVRFLVETIPFMNARLQGLYRLGRGAAENPKAFALKGMMIMAASIALWMINKDDARYEELEEWDKDTYWHFWTGDQHWRIPKPFEVGIIFGTIPERILDAAYREGDDMAKVVLERIAWNAWQVFNFGSAPVPIQVTVEQIANRHFFTGRPIVGQREAGRLAGDQYSEWTHETSKLVGGAMGISPDRIDHFVRGFTGSIGEYAMGASDMLIRSIGDYPNEPSLRADEIPILKRFKRSDPPKSTKYRTEFWDLFKEIEKAQGSYRQAQQERNRDRRIELKQDHGGELRLRERFNKARAELQNISERRRKIHHNTNMSPEEKRGLIDNLIVRSNRIYKQTVELAELRGVKA